MMNKPILGANGLPISADVSIDTGQMPIDIDERNRAERRRQDRENNKFLNEKVTRKDILDLVGPLEAEYAERTRLLFIQVKTLTNLIVEKGIATIDELDEMSKPVIESIYGKVDKEDNGSTSSEGETVEDI